LKVRIDHKVDTMGWHEVFVNNRHVGKVRRHQERPARSVYHLLLNDGRKAVFATLRECETRMSRGLPMELAQPFADPA
jgi:hypothetical protein